MEGVRVENSEGGPAVTVDCAGWCAVAWCNCRVGLGPVAALVPELPITFGAADTIDAASEELEVRRPLPWLCAVNPPATAFGGD